MEDDSKLVIVFSVVLSVCGYGAIIYCLYEKMLTFTGGLVVGLVILTPMLSYMASKFILWALDSGL